MNKIKNKHLQKLYNMYFFTFTDRSKNKRFLTDEEWEEAKPKVWEFERTLNEIQKKLDEQS